ncbi:MAG: hypothetical protein K8R77_11575, partial [Anaerolineaceae bacterium]|nr:hypothetical protein [Anaerolineaceae bacterium]
MKAKKTISGLCLLAGLEALGALIYLLLLPTDPKNAVLWGYSAARLAMAGVLLAAAVCSIAAGRIAWRHPKRVEHGLQWLAGKTSRLWLTGCALVCLTITAWVLAWMPAYRFGGQALIVERLYPLVGWLGLSGSQALLALLVWQN